MRTKNIYAVGSIVGAAGFIFVYDSANLGSSVKYLSQYYNLSSSMVGLVVAISLLGNFFGSLTGGYLSDKIGRKKTMIKGSLVGLVGLIISGLSWNILSFCLGRIILGYSIGLVFVAAPMYITEISPADKRGQVGTIRQILLALGLMAGYTVNFIFEKMFLLSWNIHFGWRYLILIESVLLLCIILLLSLLYETPRWLMMKNRDDDAKQVLSVFIKSEERVKLVYSQMGENRSLNSEKSKIKIRGGLIYPILICIAFPIFRQLSGVNAVTYYAQKIFAEISNGGSTLAYFQSIFIGLSELIGAIVVVLFADKLGRKVFLGIGAFGMFVSEAILFYFLYKSKISIELSYLVYVYNFFYIISAGAMLTVYLSEVVPTIVRSKGIALTGILNWVFDGIVIYSFPLLNANIYLSEKFHGGFSFLIFSISMLIFFIVILFLPETKNKTLEDIESYWRKKGDW